MNTLAGRLLFHGFYEVGKVFYVIFVNLLSPLFFIGYLRDLLEVF